ncbi:MAG: protein arginine kinase [Candidatus Zixiibacteriota bacterium]
MGLNLEKMAHKPASWLAAPGQEASVVLSSRVRLARNLDGLKYPNSADDSTLEKVVTYVEAACERADDLQSASFVKSTELANLERDFLVERHLISPTFLDGDPHKALLVDPDERTSIMVNEEDHLRVQSMQPGLQLQKAYERATSYDDQICGSLDIDYDPDFGFLTACPTNVGTGMRASALIHLPGLVLTREIDNVIARISKLGLVVRGFYGEGSDVLGNLFQISNQTTLGISEAEILSSIESITRSIIDEEDIARKRLIEEAPNQIDDKVWRAYGILKYARTLTSEETMNLLSAVRLGIALERITFVKLERVNEMLLLSQPAHLQMYHGEEMDESQRDSERAHMVREKLRVGDRRDDP